METSEQESEFVRHIPCEACGSSDANSEYTDGHTHCFACEATTFPDGAERQEVRRDASLISDGYYAALPARHISEKTCRKFDYQLGGYSGKTVQIANYRSNEGDIVAQKIRDRDKNFKFLGQTKDATLFGQHLYSKGKRVVVTEGELDALSVAEQQQCKWPVVSVKNGASGAKKCVKQNLQWLLNFETVVFMFDQDEPGMKAAKECAKLLPPNRAAIASLPFNDANECLKQGKGYEIEQAIWNAKTYKPEKMVSGEDIWKRMQDRPDVVSYPYPDTMPEFNKLTYGIRLGELDTWTSGSGMGKTTVIKTMQLHFKETTGLNQAILHLEEPLEDTAEHLIGMKMGKRISLPDTIYDEQEKREVFEDLFTAKDAEGNFRLQLFDSFGSEEEDALTNIIRYYATALECKVIWLDHLSILVSDMGIEGDERRKIDSLMHILKSLTQELGIYIGLIVHLRKPTGNGKSFENGGVPTLDDLRGSGGIKQLSNNVYAVSRDQQHDNPIARNTSLLTVLKCRFTGRTGNADYVLFNNETGCLERGTAPCASDGFEVEEEF